MNYNNLTWRHFENPSHAGTLTAVRAERLAASLGEGDAQGLREGLGEGFPEGFPVGLATRLGERHVEGLATRLDTEHTEGHADRLRESHATGLGGGRIRRGAAGSRGQGTWVQFEVRLRAAYLKSAERTLILEEVRFLAYACPHVIAVADWIAAQSTGRAAQPVLPESVQALRRRFEVPIEKLGRLLIVEDAWIAALSSPGSGPAADG